MERSATKRVVSNATLRNWKRLHDSSEPVHGLTQRANKKQSTKKVFSKEYLTNVRNVKVVLNILETIANTQQEIKTVVNSLCINLLRQHLMVNAKGKHYESENRFIQDFIDEIGSSVEPTLLDLTLPVDEADIIGVIYQSLLVEGDRNIKGTYFTPQAVVNKLTQCIDGSEHKLILDPCCGTGSFLINIEGVLPENLYGIDIDPLVVMIAKTNLFIRFKDHLFSPNIFCGDYPAIGHTLFSSIAIPKKFDYIISNPPWGAEVSTLYRSYYPEITSGESFSYIIAKSLSLLKQYGELIFLLPASILNVKTHQDVRKLILERTSIQTIFLFDRCFMGVYTPVVGIRIVQKKNNKKVVTIESANRKIRCHQDSYLLNDHYVFSTTDNTDGEIIEAIYSHPYQTLSTSKWGLGIVTGDNKGKIKKTQHAGLEPIFTGKEVDRYRLKPTTSYILYDRSQLQQVAPDWLYRAKEKLVYKFISNRLVFAYNNTGCLFLNSANILIPDFDEMSTKTVLAFLNSVVFQYLYIKKFGEIKVLRGNLEKLPFPKIDATQNEQLTNLVEAALANDETAHDRIQQVLYRIWGLTTEQIAHIEMVVYG